MGKYTLGFQFYDTTLCMIYTQNVDALSRNTIDIAKEDEDPNNEIQDYRVLQTNITSNEII